MKRARSLLISTTAMMSLAGCSSLDDPLTSMIAPSVVHELHNECPYPGNRASGINYRIEDREYVPDWDKNATTHPTTASHRGDGATKVSATIARGHTINLLRCYQARVNAFAVRNDIYNVPIIGTVIAASTAGALKWSSRTSIDIALAGGAVTALSIYDHPDSTGAADLGVLQGLSCVVDATARLPNQHKFLLDHYMKVIEAAEDELAAQASDLLNEANPSTVDQQYIAAVQASLKGAQDAVTALKAELDAQDTLSGVIYTVDDKLEMQSRVAERRSAKSSDVYTTMQTALSSASSAQSAKTTADNSAGAASNASTVAKKVETAVSSAPTVKGSPSPQASDALKKVKQPLAAKGAAAIANGDTSTPDQKGLTDEDTQTTNKAAQSAAVSAKTDIDTILDLNTTWGVAYEQLNRLSQHALRAIPVPSYATMSTSVAACLTDNVAVPAPAPATTPSGS